MRLGKWIRMGGFAAALVLMVQAGDAQAAGADAGTPVETEVVENYVDVGNNSIGTLEKECNDPDFRDFLKRVAGKSTGDPPMMKISGSSYPTEWGQVCVEVTDNRDHSFQPFGAFYSVLEKYIALRGLGFSQPFATAAILQSGSAAPAHDADITAIHKKYPEYPVLWIRRIGSPLPPSAYTLGGPDRCYYIPDSAVSVLFGFIKPNKEPIEWRIDSQEFNPDFQEYFKDASAQCAQPPGDISGYWNSVRKYLHHKYGVTWLAPNILMPGSYD